MERKKLSKIIKTVASSFSGSIQNKDLDAIADNLIITALGGIDEKIMHFFEITTNEAKDKNFFSTAPIDTAPLQKFLKSHYGVKEYTIKFLPANLDELLVYNNILPSERYITEENCCSGCPIESNKILYHEDIKKTFPSAKCWWEMEIQDSILCIPLTVNAKVTAALSIIKNKEPRLTQYDIMIFSIFQSILSLALNSFLQTEVRKLAEITDGITKVFNYKHFISLLSLEIERSRRYNHKFSLILFDIDDFKEINDTLGRNTGDIILKEVGKLTRTIIRSTDQVFRYTGATFAVILPETHKKGALMVAEKVRKQIINTPIFCPFTNQQVKIKISGGVATFPEDSTIESKLITYAENTLCNAKQSGKNTIKG